MGNNCLMSVDGTDFCIPQKGQAKKGNPLEEGGGEEEGEEWLERTRTDEDKEGEVRDNNVGQKQMRTKPR